MKRRLELLRDLLLRCEEDEGDWFTYTETWINEGGWPEDRSPLFADESRKWSDEELYHIKLLHDAGLIYFQEVGDAPWLGMAEFEPVKETIFRMTNAGHDYLDAVRDQGIWEQTKRVVLDTGGNATLEIVKTLATGFLKKKITEHTGVNL